MHERFGELGFDWSFSREFRHLSHVESIKVIPCDIFPASGAYHVKASRPKSGCPAAIDKYRVASWIEPEQRSEIIDISIKHPMDVHWPQHDIASTRRKGFDELMMNQPSDPQVQKVID